MALVLFEVADKIPHPSLAGFWLTSIVIGACLAGLARWTGRQWPCFAIAGTWFLGAALWSSIWFGGPGHGEIHRAFVHEVGSEYFVSLMVAAFVPMLVVLTMLVARHRPQLA